MAALAIHGTAPGKAPTPLRARTPKRTLLGRATLAVALAAAFPAPAANAANMTYHGGSLMGTAGQLGEHTVIPIYWAPPPAAPLAPSYTFPDGYANAINGFLTDVAADSGKPTNVYATNT